MRRPVAAGPRVRLLVLAERYGPAGGMERYVDIVVRMLRARGDRIDVFARSLARSDAHAREVVWSDEHDCGSADAAVTIARAIAGGCYEAVIAHNVMDDAVVSAARTARRLVYHLHDHRPTCPNGDRLYPRTRRRCGERLGGACVVHALTEGCMYGPRPRSVALVRRREQLRDAIARADAVVANSAFIANRARENGIAVAAAITPPIEEAAFAQPVVAERPYVVLFAGRLEPQKGLTSLIRALARLPAAQRPLLVVAGSGSDETASRAVAARGAVAVEWLGRLAEAALHTAIDRAGIVALPSLWDEPFGMSGIEAFARGRAVVAYDVGGVSSWLRDGRNGALVRPGDEAALAEAIASYARADLREAHGDAARRDAEAYRASAIVPVLRAIYGG